MKVVVFRGGGGDWGSEWGNIRFSIFIFLPLELDEGLTILDEALTNVEDRNRKESSGFC